MYAGFITPKHSIKRLGIHQRLDVAAHRMVSHYLAPGSFPLVKQILNFEGQNGPDGLKVKSPGAADPDHFYNPITDTGELPEHIKNHYDLLVEALSDRDMVRSGFEASWLAHYVVDGLTPAHHELLGEAISEIQGGPAPLKGKLKYIASGKGSIKKNWAVWGGKGIISMHHNFELGIASVLVGRPIRTKLDAAKLAHARQVGYMAFFKEESKSVAQLDLYSQFKKSGWTANMAASIKKEIIPRAAQAVAIIWLLAYLEAGFNQAKKVAVATAV
ncbi:MAG TPA: hypothetical protein VLE72_03460 [Candidatus Saccharimonadales bacterium]|nr:hypothetical protein [Candidatus Saccharimonadales bacterium]